MAVKLGAKQVYACELDVTMVNMSHDILTANGMRDNITLLHSLSTKLSVPRDLPERYKTLKRRSRIPRLTVWNLGIRLDDCMITSTECHWLSRRLWMRACLASVLSLH